MSIITAVEGLTDSYKVGMSKLHKQQREENLWVSIMNSYSNFTARKNAFMKFSEQSDGKIVVYGTRSTFQEVIDLFDETFFSVSEEQAMKRIRRRLKAHFGSIEEHKQFRADMLKLHKLGFVPIEVRSIDEGTRYPLGLPLFTVKSTVDGYGWLVNFIESLSSNLFWPMTNTATKIEQFYLQAKHYGELSAPKEIVDLWLPICVHEFGFRGYMGPEAGIRMSSAQNLFFQGSDSWGALDFFEKYYGYNMDEDISPAVSVRASEHADVSRLLSEYRYRAQKIFDEGGSDADFKLADGSAVPVLNVIENTEYYVMFDLALTTTGIFSYVSDTENYFRTIYDYAKLLKEVILNRKAREDGQPPIFVFRPDSSRHRPLDVICGYRIFDVSVPVMVGDVLNIECDDSEHIAVRDTSGRYFMATDVQYTDEWTITEEITKQEAEGTIRTLYETFPGATLDTAAGPMKFLDPSVGCIYGEAISQTHQKEIYERLIELGFSATCILMGKGSYATLENNTRDLFSMSYKQTFSEARIGKYHTIIDVRGRQIEKGEVDDGVCFRDEDTYFIVDASASLWTEDGDEQDLVVITISEEEALGERVDLEQQKIPLGDVSKKSAKGRLRVERNGDEWTLHQEQTEEQEQQGMLTLLLRDGVFYKNPTLQDIQKQYAKG